MLRTQRQRRRGRGRLGDEPIETIFVVVPLSAANSTDAARDATPTRATTPTTSISEMVSRADAAVPAGSPAPPVDPANATDDRHPLTELGQLRDRASTRHTKASTPARSPRAGVSPNASTHGLTAYEREREVRRRASRSTDAKTRTSRKLNFKKIHRLTDGVLYANERRNACVETRNSCARFV